MDNLRVSQAWSMLRVFSTDLNSSAALLMVTDLVIVTHWAPFAFWRFYGLTTFFESSLTPGSSDVQFPIRCLGPNVLKSWRIVELLAFSKLVSWTLTISDLNLGISSHCCFLESAGVSMPIFESPIFVNNISFGFKSCKPLILDGKPVYTSWWTSPLFSPLLTRFSLRNVPLFSKP